MDIYQEKEEAKRLYFYDKMIDRKNVALEKLSFFSDDYEIRERFAKMMIDAEAESIQHASEFMGYFDLDAMDKMAILEDLECFIAECIEENENNYAEDKYNG